MRCPPSGGTRRVNLVWICRDPSLVEFFLSTCDFDQYGWTLIYYTGASELMLADPLPSTVHVINGRPDLDKVIREMIAGIEKGDGLPEDTLAEAESYEVKMTRHLAEDGFRIQLKRALDMYSPEELFNMGCAYSRKEGHTPPACSLAGLQQLLLSLLDFEDDESISAKQVTWSIYPAEPSLPRNNPYKRTSYLLPSKEEHIESIDELLKWVDTDENGMLSRTDFDSFLVHLQSSLSQPAAPSLKRSLSRCAFDNSSCTYLGNGAYINRNVTPEQFIAFVGGEQVIQRWQMLYCGACAPVVRSLQSISKKYSIKLRTESFDW